MSNDLGDLPNGEALYVAKEDLFNKLNIDVDKMLNPGEKAAKESFELMVFTEYTDKNNKVIDYYGDVVSTKIHIKEIKKIIFDEISTAKKNTTIEQVKEKVYRMGVTSDKPFYFISKPEPKFYNKNEDFDNIIISNLPGSSEVKQKLTIVIENPSQYKKYNINTEILDKIIERYVTELHINLNLAKISLDKAKEYTFDKLKITNSVINVEENNIIDCDKIIIENCYFDNYSDRQSYLIFKTRRPELRGNTISGNVNLSFNVKAKTLLEYKNSEIELSSLKINQNEKFSTEKTTIKDTVITIIGFFKANVFNIFLEPGTTLASILKIKNVKKVSICKYNNSSLCYRDNDVDIKIFNASSIKIIDFKYNSKKIRKKNPIYIQNGKNNTYSTDIKISDSESFNSGLATIDCQDFNFSISKTNINNSISKPINIINNDTAGKISLNNVNMLSKEDNLQIIVRELCIKNSKINVKNLFIRAAEKSNLDDSEFVVNNTFVIEMGINSYLSLYNIYIRSYDTKLTSLAPENNKLTASNLTVKSTGLYEISNFSRASMKNVSLDVAKIILNNEKLYNSNITIDNKKINEILFFGMTTKNNFIFLGNDSLAKINVILNKANGNMFYEFNNKRKVLFDILNSNIDITLNSNHADILKANFKQKDSVGRLISIADNVDVLPDTTELMVNTNSINSVEDIKNPEEGVFLYGNITKL